MGSPSLNIWKGTFDATWLRKTHKHTMPTLLLVYWSLYEFSEVTGLINIFGCFEIVCLILNATTCFQQLQLQWTLEWNLTAFYLCAHPWLELVKKCTSWRASFDSPIWTTLIWSHHIILQDCCWSRPSWCTAFCLGKYALYQHDQIWWWGWDRVADSLKVYLFIYISCSFTELSTLLF
jgi:hypothetical protein